ncbi:hypothetical protein ZIOFF_068297 [Zingiber officinale]|uniref:Uncharacterized protein n=1 Tax=Zingiber officinale TaxID=94328 RepID=A0A8J5C809_ZINOF|nr:hypothetical protein ZIOFF_068297 [Zingiber officinale]
MKSRGSWTRCEGMASHLSASSQVAGKAEVGEPAAENMTFTVTKASEGYARPAEPTPPGSLTLDWIGRYPTHLVDSLHIYKHGQNPAKAICKALAP